MQALTGHFIITTWSNVHISMIYILHIGQAGSITYLAKQVCWYCPSSVCLHRIRLQVMNWLSAEYTQNTCTTVQKTWRKNVFGDQNHAHILIYSLYKSKLENEHANSKEPPPYISQTPMYNSQMSSQKSEHMHTEPVKKWNTYWTTSIASNAFNQSSSLHPVSCPPDECLNDLSGET